MDDVVVGRTRSDRPIYAHEDAHEWFRAHGQFSAADHADAVVAHAAARAHAADLAQARQHTRLLERHRHAGMQALHRTGQTLASPVGARLGFPGLFGAPDAGAGPTPRGPQRFSKARSRTKVATVMHEFKHGTLHSGSPQGPLVRDRQQALAIATAEAGMSKGRTCKACGILSDRCGHGCATASCGHDWRCPWCGGDLMLKQGDR